MGTNGNERDSWPQELGSAVRAQRKRLGLTQLELSALAGCGPVFVYDVERGKRGLRLDKLVELLAVLGLQFKLEPGKAGLRVGEELR